MKDDIFIAHMAKGAAVTVAGALLIGNPSVSSKIPLSSHEISVTEHPNIQSGINNSVSETRTCVFKHRETEWTKRMEKEFRCLALAEATETITPEQLVRLETLSALREEILAAPNADEVLLQLKRDKIVETMAETLRKYVEFQEISSYTRSST